MGKTITIKNMLRWNVGSSIFAFIDENGELKQHKGRIIRNRHGVYTMMFRGRDGQNRFKDLEQVVLGTTTLAGQQFFFGDIVEIAGVQLEVEYGDENGQEHLLGVYFNGAFFPLHKIDEHLSLVKPFQKNEKLKGDVAKYYISLQKAFDRQMILIFDQEEKVVCHTAASTQHNLLASLEAVVYGLSFLPSNIDGVEFTFLERNDFFSNLAKGSLLKSKLSQNNLVFGGIDYTTYSEFFQKYLERIEKFQEHSNLIFQSENNPELEYRVSDKFVKSY